MTNLVQDFLSKNKSYVPEKIILNSDLTPNSKIVLLDRQTIKYFTQPDRYSRADIAEFRSQVLKDYDKSCNVISIYTAFYEGGSGYFESESQKRHTANLDLQGISNCFKFASVDEHFFQKNMKAATSAFVYDSGVLAKNKKFNTVLKCVYNYYLELVELKFCGAAAIERAIRLKSDMDTNGVSVGDPIAQYCFSLLTNYKNAKKIFKVKGLQKKSEEDMQKLLYNAYADLRIIQDINGLSSYLNSRFEFCFVTNDRALLQFKSELEVSIKRELSFIDQRTRRNNIFKGTVNFEIFNKEIFKGSEWLEFRQLFYDWSD